MLDSLGAIKELYEASKGGEVLAAINHAAKMTTSTLPFTGFSRSQIRSIPTRYPPRSYPNLGFLGSCAVILTFRGRFFLLRSPNGYAKGRRCFNSGFNP